MVPSGNRECKQTAFQEETSNHILLTREVTTSSTVMVLYTQVPFLEGPGRALTAAAWPGSLGEVPLPRPFMPCCWPALSERLTAAPRVVVWGGLALHTQGARAV